MIGCAPCMYLCVNYKITYPYSGVVKERDISSIEKDSKNSFAYSIGRGRGIGSKTSYLSPSIRYISACLNFSIA